MKILPDDPRLTAYALGEIEDVKEYAELEAAVQASPELAKTVAQIREMETLLTDSLGAEALPELSEFEKEKLQTDATSVKSSRKWVAWPVWGGIAAMLVLALVMISEQGIIEENVAYDPSSKKPAVEAEKVKADGAFKEDFPKELVEGTSQPMRMDGIEADATEAPQLMFEQELGDSSVGRDESRSSTLSSEKRPNLAGEKNELAKQPVITEPFPVAVVETQAQSSSGSVDNFAPPSPGEAKARPTTRPLVSAPSRASSNLSGSADLRSGLVGGAISIPKMQVEAGFSTEKYDPIEETGFRSPLVAPLSTFSIDVDTASYANVRRYLNQGHLPPKDAVRIEELINYFPYADAAPSESLDAGGAPFAVHLAQVEAPWNRAHRLVRIALKGYEMPWEERPASNLVFLLDVSGSMNRGNKLPLVKEAMQLLVDRLGARDRVAVVVYAGASGLALPSTTANNQETIAHAMANLEAGGSTNGGAGIELAYKVAREHFIKGGNNRVILCTDGDFNVGQTQRGGLTETAAAAAEEGIALTVLGFGMGNLKDDLMQDLAQQGKGSYAYVDSEAEARKVFLEDLSSNLFTIAKDVKIQVEFNPAQVNTYRLIGYENRRLKAEDFNNDTKKAGNIGPGHSIVALYEIIPNTGNGQQPDVDPLKYQANTKLEPTDDSGELATVKLRYKQPDSDTSALIEEALSANALTSFENASDDVQFSAMVAAFGMLLRETELGEGYDMETIRESTLNTLGKDPGGHRAEFLTLIRKAGQLLNEQPEGAGTVR